MLAQLGLVATLIQRQRFAEAQQTLDRLTPATSPYVEVPLFDAVLLSFSGEHAKALAVAQEAKTRFPNEARLPALLAHLYFLTDNPAAMKASIDEALALDPENQFAWHWRGIYYHFVAPNADLALESYRRSLEINSDFMASWNNLGVAHLELGNDKEAKAAIQKAMAVDPKVALPVANYGTSLWLLDRSEDAEREFDRALRLEPGQAESLLGKGFLLIERGKPAAAVPEILKAIAANPTLPDAHMALAAAYYQSGRYPEAMRAAVQARTIDPGNPVPPLMASIMAQDQARAGEAIEFAQEALQKARKFGTFAVQSIANTRSGESNVGSAYRNLGMNGWGTYYADLSFNPYEATGYFFLSSEYPSASARRSSTTQGLLLDPTAVSFPTRYFEFLRQPRHDLTLGATIGDEGGGTVQGASGTFQGFVRASDPTAYFVNFTQRRSDGFRPNSSTDNWTFEASVGSRLDERRQNLLLNVFATRAKRGLPGSVSDSDPDDSGTLQEFDISVGYHLRLAFDNRVLARVGAGSARDTRENPAPYGTGFSALDLSLINALGSGDIALGVSRTNALYAMGLYDATTLFLGDANNPRLATGPLGALLGTLPGFSPLPNTMPTAFDTKLLRSFELETTHYEVQLRHLLTVGSVDFTYGLEWFPTESRTTITNNALEQVGTGALLDGISFPFVFPFGTKVSVTSTFQNDAESAQAYAQALWRISPKLSAEGGLFLRYLDRSGIGDQSEVDPRLGLGWNVAAGHWLRLAAEREFQLPLPPRGSLAPVAVVGLVVPDAGALRSGGVRKSLQARWDAEWGRNLYTFVAAEEQEFDGGLAFPTPGTFFGSTEVQKGWLRRLAIGTNVWLGGSVGLSASMVGTSSGNKSGGADDGKALPFTSDLRAQGGITWVHPSQLTVALVGAYTGDRWGNAANTVKLGGYWTLNGSVSWQPLQKHVALNLSLVNILDKSFEVAPGFPGPGRAVLFTAQYRF